MALDRALDTPGGPDDLSRLVSQLASGDFPGDAPLLVRALWEARYAVVYPALLRDIERGWREGGIPAPS